MIWQICFGILKSAAVVGLQTTGFLNLVSPTRCDRVVPAREAPRDSFSPCIKALLSLFRRPVLIMLVKDPFPPHRPHMDRPSCIHRPTKAFAMAKEPWLGIFHPVVTQRFKPVLDWRKKSFSQIFFSQVNSAAIPHTTWYGHGTLARKILGSST